MRVIKYLAKVDVLIKVSTLLFFLEKLKLNNSSQIRYLIRNKKRIRFQSCRLVVIL